VNCTPFTLWDLVGMKLFYRILAICQTVAVAIFSGDLGQSTRRAAGGKQRRLPSDHCGSEPDEEPITVISQVDDRGFFW
jgi:hypothetical protein